MPVHVRIRQRREGLGLTQNDLAKRLRTLGVRVDIASISRLENGHRDLRTSELTMYARALECRVSDLVDEVD